jgi:spermidine/putrescine transport system substrate-binding protein
MNKKKSIVSHLLIGLFYFLLITFCLSLPKIFEKKHGLTLYTYADMIPSEVLHRFEEETGIPVYVKFFSSNEEMYAKLKIDKGSGYDLITPTDYMVDILRKDDLLLELDHTQIPLLKKCDTRILNTYFDPGNRYSMPIAWIAYGIGYSKKRFGDQLPCNSWKLVFDPPVDQQGKSEYYISMLDDGREASFLATLYAYQGRPLLEQSQIDYVTGLLKKQWSFVENYTNVNQPFYLQSGLVPLIVVANDIMFRILEDNDTFGFVIPEEGSILVVENMVIPKTCTDVQSTHKLINYIMSARAQLEMTLEYGYSPVNVQALTMLKKEAPFHVACTITDAEFKRMRILDNDLSIEVYSDMWLKVKSER